MLGDDGIRQRGPRLQRHLRPLVEVAVGECHEGEVDELDGGEIILQKSFTKNLNDNLEDFTAKIREIEHEILPLSVIKILND